MRSVQILLLLFIGSGKVSFGFQSYPRSILQSNNQIQDSFTSQIHRHALNDVTTEFPDGEDHKKKAQRRQLSKAYHACSYVLGITSVSIFVIKDTSQNRLLTQKVAGAVGFGLAAGVSHILGGATDQNRLGSDTYKRLNLGLLGFSTLGLLVVPGEAGFLPTANTFLVAWTLLSLVKGLTAVVAWEGWKRGVDSNSSLVAELIQGIASTLQGIWFTKKRGAAYRNPLVLVILGMVSSFFEGCFFVTYKMPTLDTSLWWSAVGRLFLITTMMYSLKDAADRERLSGTTFIQLNFMMFVWLFTVGIAQSLRVGEPFLLSKASLLPLSIPFLIETCRYQMEKYNKSHSVTTPE